MTAAGDGRGLSPQRDELLQFQAVEGRYPGRLPHASAGETREVRNIHGRVYMDVMSLVSSVNLTPEVGARLQEGDEFGLFLFGGADVVMLQRVGEIR